MLTTLDADLRNDARERFRGPLWEDVTYEQLEPAYQYGVKLADNARWTESNLHELDEYARSHWTREYPFNWINMKEAIEYGFACARLR